MIYKLAEGPGVARGKRKWEKMFFFKAYNTPRPPGHKCPQKNPVHSAINININIYECLVLLYRCIPNSILFLRNVFEKFQKEYRSESGDTKDL